MLCTEVSGQGVAIAELDVCLMEQQCRHAAAAPDAQASVSSQPRADTCSYSVSMQAGFVAEQNANEPSIAFLAICFSCIVVAEIRSRHAFLGHLLSPMYWGFQSRHLLVGRLGARFFPWKEGRKESLHHPWQPLSP